MSRQVSAHRARPRLSSVGRIGSIASRYGSDQEFAAAHEGDTPVASKRDRLEHAIPGAWAFFDVSSSRAESLRLSPPFLKS